MNEVEKERERCAQLVTNALKRHEESPTVAPVLKRLRARIQHPLPKTSCSDGGRSQGSTQSDSPSASAELTSTT